VEEIELLAETAVVALFGLFEHVQIGILIFLSGPGRAVDALQHLVLRVAAPVGTGHLHQLEDLELAGRRHVRATAQVGEITLAIERDILACRNRGNDLGLVVLADGLE
jgi:hypothetical protein